MHISSKQKNRGHRFFTRNRVLVLFVLAAAAIIFAASSASALNLWTRGTAVEAEDGNILFWQTWDNAFESFKVHDITYSSDGNNVKAWILEPKSEGPHPVMLFCKGGSARTKITWWATYREEDGMVASFTQRELMQYAAAGMMVVASNNRRTGETVAKGGPPYNPTNPATEADASSGGEDPFESVAVNTGYSVGEEVNDIINLLPLIQKLALEAGNGGLNMQPDFDRIYMLGHSMGGARSLCVLRELGNQDKYGDLPRVQKLAVKGAITDFVSWLKDLSEGKSPIYGYPITAVAFSARAAGNFYWTYPDDFESPDSSLHAFYSFFGVPFPAWNYDDPDNDAWPDLGATEPPSYPVNQVYSEEFYYRSATMWDQFWTENKTPVMIQFSKGDTQIMWTDGQALYDKMIGVGDPELYEFKLYEDADENGPACSFLGQWSLSLCDHAIVADNYGVGDIMTWFGPEETKSCKYR